MKKISVSPGKTVSAGLIAVLIFLLIFGIGFAFLVGNVLSENDASTLMTSLFYVFMIGWIGTVLFLLIYNLKNLGTEREAALIEVSSEEEDNVKKTGSSPAQSLRDLESLRKEGLITENEYKIKRAQILGEKWN